ncbi:META domain-containing protein [Brevibacterium sp. 5221]|uniref:META domain-containing protein n=1 Tax=Brevibacterium rongguiense TaxID=2695267 RepID=A0A6N9H8N1_9MICO|nr:META domain-containing protein [Brevibacterium rongguiense]MYM20387.1 META domain-containing protein [Brevibacterium rongguiense]
MKRTLSTTFAGLIAAAALLSGCGENGATVESSQQPTTEAPRSILGTWGSDEKGHPHLTFNADGSVEGTDGCNGIHTTFTKTDGGAELKPYMTTLRACVGVNSWLRNPRRAVLDGDELILFNAKAEKLGALHFERDATAPASS